MKQLMLEKTKDFVKGSLREMDPGHDWFHAERVWKLSRRIAEKEKSDLTVVQLAALLHDVADSKFVSQEESIKKIEEFLKTLGLEKNKIENILHIIENISFKGAGAKNKIKTIEGKIVQDADRLDALGAIGIARCFSYSGHKKTPLNDPDIKPRIYISEEDYRKNNGTAINHFYEKLLLLKDRMNTEPARRMAEERHKFMEEYIRQFLKEWNSA